MKYLQQQGSEVPALGFGTFRMEGRECVDAVNWALEIGYRNIDTAQRYENEQDVGLALEESNVPRDEIFLTTKIGMANLQPDQVRTSTDDSLNKLRTDYVDLLLIHWPVKEIPLADTLGAMVELQSEKKARHIGVCNFTIPMIEEAVDRLGIRLFTNQIEYHPLLRQETLNQCVFDHDMVLTGHSPIATGRLIENERLKKISAKYKKSSAQVAIRWQLEQDNVMVIPKSKRKEIIAENFDVFDFELSSEDMAEINSLPRNDRGVRPPFEPDWDPNTD